MTDTQYDLTYVMERRDFVALTFALTRPSPGRLVRSIVLAIMVFTAAYAIGNGTHAATLLERPLELAVLAGYELLFILLIFFLLRWLYLWVAASTVFGRNAAAGKRMRFEIDDDTIVGGQEGISTTVRWLAVVRLIERPDYLFIALSRREAMILPRRAFGDQATFEGFIAFARGHVAATRSVDPARQSA